MTKREEVLTKLLTLTWKALPDVLTEDCLHETDVETLALLSEAVGVALGKKRVRWSTFDAFVRSFRAQKGWLTRRRKAEELPPMRVLR